MKRIIYVLASLMLLVVMIFYGWETLFENGDPGYVILGIGRWSLESTLAFFAVVLWFSFTIFYLLVRWLGWFIRLPKKIKLKDYDVTLNRSKEALVSGLVDCAEGNWERSEKVLIKHASSSTAPLVYYLTAARAAHLRGAADSRESYLNMAADQAPGSEFAIGLTKAEFDLSLERLVEAKDILLHLQAKDPSHPGVTKLLYQVFLKQDDWQSLLELFPILDKGKVLLEAERKTLAIKVYGGLLQQHSSNDSVVDVERLWKEIPDDIKAIKDVAYYYFTAMIQCGAGAAVEKQIVEHLLVDKDDALLDLYGEIVSDDVNRQIQVVEQWAQLYPRNPVLLQTVGKLFYLSGNWEQAQVFLNRSIGLKPSVSAYHMLADIMKMKGDHEQSSELYKQGLVLGSDQPIKGIMVTQSDQISSEDSADLVPESVRSTDKTPIN